MRLVAATLQAINQWMINDLVNYIMDNEIENVIYAVIIGLLLCGSVAEWLGRWTCDQQVASSNPGLSAIECNPGQVVNIHVPLSPSSIIWYQPMGGDALRLGR